MIRLFTSLYNESNELRCLEIDECMCSNLNNSKIEQMDVIFEKRLAPEVKNPKLLVRSISHRPKYSEFFDWANALVSADNDISILANSDIYFDSSLSALARNLMPNQCAALSRWDVQPDGTSRLFDRNDSQDAWVFRGKIRPIVPDFCMGIPRCDNRMLYELRAAGYEVINPAFSVKVFHLHAACGGFKSLRFGHAMRP